MGSTAQLRAAGFTGAKIARAVNAGAIIRVRRGWFALPDTPFAHRIPVELGGRVAGLTAARSYGLWTKDDRRIHVSWEPHGNITHRAARRFTNVARHWRALDGAAPPQQPWRESLEQALAQVILLPDRASALATVDSALHLGMISPRRLRCMLDRMPERVSWIADAADGRADSGLESIVRLWLTDEGLLPLVHPTIIGLEVDLLVGSSLVIEVDGEEFHAGPEAFETDRRRDAALGAVGCIPVRFSYSQVMFDWTACEARLRTHLDRGDHLRPLTVPVLPSPEF